jgi:hypothetical protein
MKYERLLRLANVKKEYGRELWLEMHSAAAKLSRRSERDASAFAKIIRAVQTKFECSICKKHMANMIRELPPEKWAHMGRIGMVALVYAYHSIVNRDLGKHNWPFLKLEKQLVNSVIYKELREDSNYYKIGKIIGKFMYR